MESVRIGPETGNSRMKSTPADQPVWHTLSVDDVLGELSSSPQGLASSVARERLESIGPNEWQAGHRNSAWQSLLAQFKNVLLLILIVATALSLAAGSLVLASTRSGT